MAALRDPDTGCPWDIEQTMQSIIPHTIEEAYEVADAIENGSIKDIKDELGDLLFQVIYYAQIAKEQNWFDFDDIANHIAEKMIYRHPHVFGDQKADNSAQVDQIWENQKDKKSNHTSALDGITKGLPALLRAQKIQKRAAKTGFEWAKSDDAFAKIEEEIIELKQAKTTQDKEEELGDLLFAVVNYARMEGMNSEEALRRANYKFTQRFQHIERIIQQKGQKIEDLTLSDLLTLWNEAKKYSD